MEKLLSFLNNNADKVTHFLVGYLVSTVFPSPSHGLYAVIVIAALKELYDSQHSNAHTCDFYDFLATVMGGILGFIVISGR